VERNDRLIVVVTRGDAERGSERDEFVGEWGFGSAVLFGCERLFSRAAVLVFHGCKDCINDILSICKNKSKFEEAIAPGEVSIDGIASIHLFLHAIDDPYKEGIHNELKNLFPERKIIFDTYSSGGDHLAIEGLFEKVQSKEDLKDCYDRITDIPSGRQMLDGCLLWIQKCMLRIYLNIDILLNGHDTNAEAVEDAKKDAMLAARDANKIANRKIVRKEGAQQALEKEITTGRTHTHLWEYVGALRMGTREKLPPDLKPEAFWRDLRQREAYEYESLKKKDYNTLRESFRRLAEAIDNLRTSS
jgi:hypothetical protein